MTSLLIGTFVISGLHTLLWLPRAFQMRRELKAEEEAADAEVHSVPGPSTAEGDSSD